MDGGRVSFYIMMIGRGRILGSMMDGWTGGWMEERKCIYIYIYI